MSTSEEAPVLYILAETIKFQAMSNNYCHQSNNFTEGGTTATNKKHNSHHRLTPKVSAKADSCDKCVLTLLTPDSYLLPDSSNLTPPHISGPGTRNTKRRFWNT